MITLDNGLLQAVFNAKGAELQKLVMKSSGINYMWSGDPAYWGKFSPVLFPIVGSLKQDKYLYNGKEYSLPRHGFARDRVFGLNQVDATKLVFTLKDDAVSRAVYPFAFQLQLTYELVENSLSCSYNVLNTGNGELYFSVGAHPAFAVPMPVPGLVSEYTDYWLDFDRSTQLLRWKLEDGLVSTHTNTLQLSNGRLPLSHELFRDDALVLKDLPDSRIRLVSDKHPHGIEFRFEGFPFFGIWAAPNAPFVCLEPWCGIADDTGHDQQLTTKTGIRKIAAGEDWSRKWEVNCF